MSSSIGDWPVARRTFFLNVHAIEMPNVNCVTSKLARGQNENRKRFTYHLKYKN